jgi:molybdopterin molybdotransferase
MKTNIALEEARELLLDFAQPVEDCLIALPESLGRVLSQDISASFDLPPFDKSPLDGYALRAADIKDAARQNPVTLQVIEEIQAGYMPREQVAAGTAIKVMTGAPIPVGADAVVKFEDVQRTGDLIELTAPEKSGGNIISLGEDVKQGEIVAQRGTLINPPLLGLLAAVGISQAPVFRQLKTAIFSTGDELMEPKEKLLPGKIYDSNLHSLFANCASLGAVPTSLGTVPDEKEAIVNRLLTALDQADVVITTGGVSVGDFDLVPAALAEIGAEVIFHRLKMKPGSPMIAAQYQNKLIIGLSGNPAAAFITFDLIAVPALKKMMGLSSPLYPELKAILTETYNKPSNQRRFLRAKLYQDKEKLCVKLTGNQSNGILKSLVNCNALIDIPAGSGSLAAGAEVRVVMLGGTLGEENFL